MKKVLIFSAGSLGKEILDLVKLIYKKKKTFEIVGFVDNELRKKTKKIYDIKVYNNDEFPTKDIYGVCGLMNPIKRYQVVKNEIGKKLKFANIIHPDVFLPDTSKLGKGNVIFGNVHISYEVRIANFSIISNFCDVGHNLKSGNFLTLMPSVLIGGNCAIGDNVFMGAGSIIHQGIKIGNNCKIGSTSHITKNIKNNKSVANFQRQVISKN